MQSKRVGIEDFLRVSKLNPMGFLCDASEKFDVPRISPPSLRGTSLFDHQVVTVTIDPLYGDFTFNGSTFTIEHPRGFKINESGVLAVPVTEANTVDNWEKHVWDYDHMSFQTYASNTVKRTPAMEVRSAMERAMADGVTGDQLMEIAKSVVVRSVMDD